MHVWPGHPLEGEALGTLRRVRQQAADLRARIAEHNEQHAGPAQYRSVVFYAGQCVTEEMQGTETEDEVLSNDDNLAS
jgi:hypothetical protein